MSYIFYDCESLSSLPDISKWNTTKVTIMDNMFNGYNHYHLYLIFQNGILRMLII